MVSLSKVFLTVTFSVLSILTDHYLFGSDFEQDCSYTVFAVVLLPWLNIHSVIHSLTHGAPLHGRDLRYNHDVDGPILWDYETEADIDVDANIDDGDNKGPISDIINGTHANDIYWY